MRNFTKIVLSLAMAFGLLGGVNSVKAGKKYWSPSNAVASWTPATNTMSWSSGDYGGFHVIYTGFTPAVQNNGTEFDFSDFNKVHFTVESITDGAKLQLQIVSTGKETQKIDVPASGDIFFADYASDIDITKVTELSLWATGTSDGTAVITSAYLQCVKNVASNSLNTEITSMDYLTGGGTFVIANAASSAISTYRGSVPEASATNLNDITDGLYYCFTIDALPALDIDNDGNPDAATYYRIAIKNTGGTAKPTDYWHGNYVNRIGWGSLWSTSCQADGSTLGESAYGRDGDYNAVWTITYESGNGFVFFNPKNNVYMTLNSTAGTKTYLRLYQGVSLDINSELDKEDNAANDAIFDFANATGYDAATHKFTNGGWTFASPVDMSNWDYLVITTINNASAASCKISIADNDGNSVTGDQYKGSVAGTGNDMYLDQWNHQNAIRISMDYLRANKGLDISQIKSLTFADNNCGDIVISIANVYLTDYNNTKINGGYPDGDVKRAYNATGKFGTICLPYKASCAGAVIYEIAGKTASGITLSEVTGLLEAGKPYFYVSSDEIGKDNAGAVRNVNFFRADLAKYDAATAGTNNGLIGTFSDITAPTGANYYVLSNNKLYNVDSSVTVGANKAYVDISAITPSLARGVVDLDFNEPTGIETVANSQEVNANSKFFNLAGQRVAQPTKGLYIVNGKKVLVK